MLEKKVNYNLIYALKILLEECHITKAGKSLNISQPAMSATLNRLRETFHDELLVRVNGKMQLTEKAQDLLQKVSPLVGEVESFFTADDKFVPQDFKGQYTIGSCDLSTQILLPSLIKEMEAQHCDARINIRVINQSNTYQALSEDKVDLVVGYYPNHPESLFKQRLLKDKIVCVVGESSQLAHKDITLETFLASKRIYYAYKDGLEDNDLQKFLQRSGISAPPFISSPFLLPSLLSLLDSDLILVTTEMHYECIRSLLPLVKKDLPLERKPHIYINQYWHRQKANVESAKWLRATVKTVFETFELKNRAILQEE